MPSINSRSDIDQIRQAVQLILPPAWEHGDVVELRALGTERATVAGYFDADHQAELIEAAVRWSGAAHGVYITLNPVMPDCLARAANRAVIYAKHTTSDKEVTHRHWMLIDTDPARPSGISANEQERDLALARATAVRAWLREQTWPDPIFADSGNGGHLLYRIDLPPDDGGLLQRVLKALSDQFSDSAVGIDLKVHNPSRISKLYGTLACKGDNVPDRPHRIARLLDVPDRVAVVPRESLEAILSTASSASETALAQPNGQRIESSGKGLNVVQYLQVHGVEVGKSKSFGDDGTLWELKRCPWRPNESDGGPFVIQFANGNVIARCHHNQCDGKGWEELRDTIEPGWRETEPKKGSGKGPSVAQQIVALASDDELFHTAENEAYATITVANRRETWRVNGEAYQLILRRRLHTKSIVATGSALDDAVATLESKAIFDGPQRSVHVRTAQDGDRLYIDLCTDTWEVVEVDAVGWRIIADPPVRFVRRPGMLPLPTPVAGGSVSQLREFVNVTDTDWPLVIAWLMAALRPTGPYPILLVNGEHGSCKSTTCRRLRSLVDPNTVPLRDAPRDEQTLMIWAKNSHVIALDNLSEVSKDLSNAMCRLATGGGHSERTHYTNDAETLFYAIRPQMLNGIGDVNSRSDFLNRALSIHLPVVPQSARRTERELDDAFTRVYGSIFGALLTAASAGLRRLPEVERLKLDLPRLADFAKWIVAVEGGLEWEPGTFMRAMQRNEGDSHELAIADSPVAEAVRSFVIERGVFDGDCTTLLKELNTATDATVQRRDGWPKNGQSLSNKLRECAPNLRALAIAVEFHDNDRPKRVTLTSLYRNDGVVVAMDNSDNGAELPAEARKQLYLSKPVVSCYGGDPTPTADDIADAAVLKLAAFWTAPPLPDAVVAGVAVASLLLPDCDGTKAADLP